MTQFKPNPFKVAWEDLIVKKIINEMITIFPEVHSITIEDIIKMTIRAYKQEMEKQKGVKE